MTPRPQRHHQRADTRHLEHPEWGLRLALHKMVDLIVDSWATIDKQAREMGGGYPSGGTTGIPSGPSRMHIKDDSNPRDEGDWVDITTVERSVLEPKPDPAHKAEKYQTDRDAWVKATLDLAGATRGLLPLTSEEADRARERPNSVEKCVECNDPIAGQVKRLDGQPYHLEAIPGQRGACFWLAYNRKRRAS